MKRTPLKQLGKVGLINIQANKKLKEFYAGVNYCEAKLEGCMGNWPLAFAHRHERFWYRPCPEKLSEYKQTIVACQSCHGRFDQDEALKKQTFLSLRGKE